MPDSNKQPVASVCESCGASFVCGAAAGSATCWCMEQAAVSVDPTPGGSCYCPSCLAQRFTAPTGEPSPAA
ncbi:cysteine-rich CWC family protein [Accumulibacter sp.]|uniref:cysteine-rich CWC family protein n=1 Tax=Accumulibacter sp. TaxID=2053492 RepID=UPI0028C43B8C|nr:cysteine-rich CWC family protein [Accumulibacter sp.]